MTYRRSPIGISERRPLPRNAETIVGGSLDRNQPFQMAHCAFVAELQRGLSDVGQTEKDMAAVHIEARLTYSVFAKISFLIA